MNQQITVAGNDVLLLPFLQATDPSISEHLLAELIQRHADPIIAKILKNKLRVSLNGSHGFQDNQDALEIASALRVTLIDDLQDIQQHRGQRLISRFSDYVAVKTYSACADYFREKNPRRWRLKNALRYQLKNHALFALWKAEDNRWYAGLREWREGATNNPFPTEHPSLKIRPVKSGGDIPIIQLLSEIFERAAAPLEFERVVSLAAEAWDIRDAPPQSIGSSDDDSIVLAVGSAPSVDLLLEQRIFLEQLWTELCELPVLQRVALLLNLRDATGGSAIFFIPHLGIASLKQIAETLELSDEIFSMLWDELPLDDARIAEMFAITRQQVINLRKTARERLARRMGKSSNLRGVSDSKKRP
jgi:hypothetical protein